MIQYNIIEFVSDFLKKTILKLVTRYGYYSAAFIIERDLWMIFILSDVNG